ncbi:pyridoxamine 5'-phosphate oxidase family protein [Clostridium saccharoperbutylacetonicum]
MINEKLLEVMSNEGVVSIVSWNNEEAHVVNTWNSYLTVVGSDRFLIPAARMRRTQKNVETNDKVKITLGSKEVMGHRNMGTGFLIEGTAKFVEAGTEFEMMKDKFPFLSRVLEITVISAKQTL